MTYLRAKRRAIQFHALNRRFGVHNETSLFEIARARGQELVRGAPQQEFKRVSDNLDQLSERASDDVSPFLAELKEQLQLHYEAYVKTVATAVKGIVEELLEPLDETNEFWQAASVGVVVALERIAPVRTRVRLIVRSEPPAAPGVSRQLRQRDA